MQIKVVKLILLIFYVYDFWEHFLHIPVSKCLDFNFFFYHDALNEVKHSVDCISCLSSGPMGLGACV